MLHDNIAAVLPLGHTRPVYARLEGTRREPHWVRAGDLHHGPEGFSLQPPWDGDGFRVIWLAAARRPEDRALGPEVHFAVHVGSELVPVAHVTLDWSLRRQIRHD